MSKTIVASGTIHWIGTGLSTGAGLGVLCDLAPRVLLWARTAAKAEDCLTRLGFSGRAATRAFDLTSLAAELDVGDLVVSMLPATEHVALLQLCIKRGAHFACSSYVSDEILAEIPAADKTGIVVLIEAGLDPGLDHVLAHQLVAQARATIGDTPAAVEFTSYCGGLPAVVNDFRYRFSWAPRGVLTALLSSARYVDEGVEKVAVHPWEATRRLEFAGEVFEGYPNRDSVPFITRYGIPNSWTLETFVRGTLRLAGWREVWAPVFAELRTGNSDRITALAHELAARHPTTDADRDRDRVVLSVCLSVCAADGRTWSGAYWLDAVGDEDQSAMARCVSLPLAFGSTEILNGTTPAGLHRAAEDANEAHRWLEFLTAHGIDCKFGVANIRNKLDKVDR
ncbi:MAG: saccharopine dehydrogenase [Pseudonocardiales bacterium]|nr:MAG: saccharopine dehydrogenase [Pseudonocardiales bacterium]